MTFSQAAVEAAAKALRAARGLYGNPTPSALRQAQAALTAALAVDGVALQGWQPIESAPKDGTPILLFLKSPIHSNDLDSYVPFKEIQSAIGWWGGDRWEISFMEEGTADSFGYSSNFYMGVINPLPSPPTHWQPLPQPPAASDREERK